MVILISHSRYQLVWQNSVSGELTLKDAYSYLNSPINSISWGKVIWNRSIPPSKSFVLWRPLHNQMPTDEHLGSSGCIVVSICNLCGKSDESSSHLFLHCCFALSIWRWFSSIIGVAVDLQSSGAVLSIINHGWSSQVQDVILAGISNILCVIWHCRNKNRFDNKVVPLSSVICMIKASIALTRNFSANHMSSSLSEFSILKYFGVTGNPRKAPAIK